MLLSRTGMPCPDVRHRNVDYRLRSPRATGARQVCAQLTGVFQAIYEAPHCLPCPVSLAQWDKQQIVDTMQ